MGYPLVLQTYGDFSIAMLDYWRVIKHLAKVAFPGG